MTFTDTHCHINEASYANSLSALKQAEEAGIKRLILVGTDENTSLEAVEFASQHDNCWASVGLHPHEAKNGEQAIKKLEIILKTARPNVVAIGECGLDYFYTHSLKTDQHKALRQQIELAIKYDLPLIFHVREAFDDFWPIFDSYSSLRGVLHSFTDSAENLQKALDRGLYIGVNGIATFTKDPLQTDMFKQVPLEKLLLETDSPYLTPVPMRGKVNEPAFLKHVAKYLADLRHTNLGELSAATELNATTLFKIQH